MTVKVAIALLLLALPCSTWSGNAAGQDRPRVVVLGDSIAAGYGVDPSEAFPALLQKKIDQEKLPYEVVNAGVSGDTTAGGLRRIRWILKKPADVLIVELGGNDGLRGIQPAATRSNLLAIIYAARAQQPAIRIVLTGMQMPPNMGAEYTRAFREIYPEVAKEAEVSLVPHLLEEVGGRSDLNQADLIHPTPQGHKVVASNVWQVLHPLLKNEDHATSSAP